MKRINRLFRIVNHLMAIKSQPGIHIEELAKKCKVSVYTIQRDITILQAVGVPISTDGGLRFAPSLFIPDISLTLNEASVLKDACFYVLEKEHENETLDRIIEKLNSSIYLQNSPLYANNKDLFGNIKEYLSSGRIEKLDEQRHKLFLEKIIMAITDSSFIEIKYAASDKEKTEILQPVSVIYQKNGWLLLAKEKEKPQLKNIKLSSIDDVVVTNLKYTTGNMVVDFNISTY